MSVLSFVCKWLCNFFWLKIYCCICWVEVGFRMFYDINFYFRELSVGGGEICFFVIWDWLYKNDNYYWLFFFFDLLWLLNVNWVV